MWIGYRCDQKDGCSERSLELERCIHGLHEFYRETGRRGQPVVVVAREVIRNAVTKNPLASPYYHSRLVWFVRRLIMRKYDCFIASEKYLRQYANSLVGIYGVWYAKTNLAERS